MMNLLAEALEGFSNGIPVWISTYETIDSRDNEKLCDDILEIKALDKQMSEFFDSKLFNFEALEIEEK